MANTVVAAMSGVPVAIQTAATTGFGIIVAPPMSFRNHTFLVKTGAGVGAGAVTAETADDPNDANTWAPVAAAVTLVASTDQLIEITGIYQFLRLRVSTLVTGGTFAADYLGGKNY